MRMILTTSLTALSLLVSASASAGEPSGPTNEQGVDAAVNAIVQELAAVGAGPRKTTVSAPEAAPGTPSTRPRLGSLADEAAAARRLVGADEGGDDHAM